MKNTYIDNIYRNKLIFILISLFAIKIFFVTHNNLYNDTDIPELIHHNNQLLQLLVPKKQCHYTSPMTLYFSPKYRKTLLSKKYEIKKINLKDKNFFVTFYVINKCYFQHLKLLQNHGLIKSDYLNGSHNIFFTPIPISRFNNKNGHEFYKYQKYTQFINGNYIFQKNILYKYYRAKEKIFAEDYNYMPKTYLYPDDKELIENKFHNYSFNLNDLWLIKPPNRANGDGLTILDSLENVNYKEYLITKYITNINLINGKKYDLRLYVLISGIKPLRIYLYKEGLVRISTEKYKLDINSVKNKFMHFTNTAINRHNKNFVSPKNSNDKTANTWNLFMYKNYLKKINIKWTKIHNKIVDIIIKAIISVYEELSDKKGYENLNEQSFSDLLGIDIMITDDFIPKLIEINYSPFMFYYSKLDKPIKSNLLVDTLNLIGIAPYSKKSHKLLNKNIRFRNNIEENVNNAYCELSRPRGDFELIFPISDNINKYKKFFNKIEKEDNLFWKKIFK